MDGEGRREREKERGPTDETAVFETLVSRLAAPRGSSSGILLFSFVG